MTKQEVLIVDGFALCPVEVSQNKDEKGRREENLMLFGPSALEWVYNHPVFPAELIEKYKLRPDSPMDRVMFVAPRIVQELFGYEYGAYREMTKNWTKDYLIWKAFPPKEAV